VRGRRLAVFSSSGGDNGMAADFASAAGLDLPAPSRSQVAAIGQLLPSYGHVSNPLDFIAGYWGAENLLTPMFTEMLGDGYDQGLLVVDHPLPELGPEVGVSLAAMVRSLGAASRATGVPGAVACVNPESMPTSMRDQVIAEGLLPLQGLHDAGPVLGLWSAYSERVASLERSKRVAWPTRMRRAASSQRLPKGRSRAPKTGSGPGSPRSAARRRISSATSSAERVAR
jgi:acetate---CoA ligase (ADP-forming)